MIKHSISKPIDVCCEIAEELYPKIKKYNIEIMWADSEEYKKKNILGTTSTYKNSNKIIIKLNAYQDYLDLLDTVQHELTHAIQHAYNKKMNHGDKFVKIHKKIKKEWRKRMLDNGK